MSLVQKGLKYNQSAVTDLNNSGTSEYFVLTLDWDLGPI
jgi:hypothetical protein